MIEAGVLKLAVVGNPVKFSRSPAIHQNFASQFNIKIDYQKIESPLDGFEKTVREFQQAGARGMNITVPFKEEAFRLATVKTERALFAGAVNTFLFEGDDIVGDNTDGLGLVNDLAKRLKIEIKNKNILILGAGGAARGIIGAFLLEYPKTIFIINRTPSRIKDLLQTFNDHAGLRAVSLNQELDEPIDLIIDTTSSREDLPPLPRFCLARNACCYDIKLAAEPTPFLRWVSFQAQSRGFGVAGLGSSDQAALGKSTAHLLGSSGSEELIVSDGLGMLIEQAALGFFMWTGFHPDTAKLDYKGSI